VDRQRAFENLVNAQGEVIDTLVQGGEIARNRADGLQALTEALGNSYEALSELVEAIRLDSQAQVAALSVRVSELESQVSTANRADQ
jgi:polyhydroxyalkanoate synthesis regulator phasin